MKSLIIGMAEMGIVKCPDRVSTLGLGSCVGVVLYDRASKIGGMVHIVLPSSGGNANNNNRAKFADTAIDELVARMMMAGANRRQIIAKMAGGAHMFGGISKNDLLRVGERNAFESRASLARLKIPLVAEDCGGSYGRTIVLMTEDGRLHIKTVGKGEGWL